MSNIDFKKYSYFYIGIIVITTNNNNIDLIIMIKKTKKC